MKSSHNPEKARNPGKLDDLKISSPAKKTKDKATEKVKSIEELAEEFCTPERKEILWNALQRIGALARKSGHQGPISEVFDKLREDS